MVMEGREEIDGGLKNGKSHIKGVKKIKHFILFRPEA